VIPPVALRHSPITKLLKDKLAAVTARLSCDVQYMVCAYIRQDRYIHDSPSFFICCPS